MSEDDDDSKSVTVAAAAAPSFSLSSSVPLLSSTADTTSSSSHPIGSSPLTSVTPFAELGPYAQVMLYASSTAAIRAMATQWTTAIRRKIIGKWKKEEMIAILTKCRVSYDISDKLPQLRDRLMYRLRDYNVEFPDDDGEDVDDEEDDDVVLTGPSAAVTGPSLRSKSAAASSSSHPALSSRVSSMLSQLPLNPALKLPTSIRPAASTQGGSTRPQIPSRRAKSKSPPQARDTISHERAAEASSSSTTRPVSSTSSSRRNLDDYFPLSPRRHSRDDSPGYDSDDCGYDDGSDHHHVNHDSYDDTRSARREHRDAVDSRMKSAGIEEPMAKEFFANVLRASGGTKCLEVFKNDIPFKHERNKREILCLARIADLIFSDNISVAVEIIARRIAGVHTADSTGSWDVCDHLEQNMENHSFVPAGILRRTLNHVARQQALMKAPEKSKVPAKPFGGNTVSSDRRGGGRGGGGNNGGGRGGRGGQSSNLQHSNSGAGPSHGDQGRG